jgi:hypothetical protein
MPEHHAFAELPIVDGFQRFFADLLALKTDLGEEPLAQAQLGILLVVFSLPEPPQPLGFGFLQPLPPWQ